MRLIDADAIIDEYCGDCAYRGTELCDENEPSCGTAGWIKNAPTVDAVPLGVWEQTAWERDIAIGQLEEHGIPFGGIAPDVVEVVRCKDCAYWKPPYMIDEEGNEKPWDGHIRFCEETESGIYVGGKCKHRLNTAYHTTDWAFREEEEFCSYGRLFDERKNNG